MHTQSVTLSAHTPTDKTVKSRHISVIRENAHLQTITKLCLPLSFFFLPEYDVEEKPFLPKYKETEKLWNAWTQKRL